MELAEKFIDELIILAEKYHKQCEIFVGNGNDFYIDKEQSLIRITNPCEKDKIPNVVFEALSILQKYQINYEGPETHHKESNIITEYRIKYNL